MRQMYIKRNKQTNTIIYRVFGVEIPITKKAL